MYTVTNWSNRDPIQEQGGLNLYGFVGNNGVNSSDKDGRVLNFLAGAVIGAAFDYAGQVAGNIKDGKSLGSALTDVSPGSIVGGALLGATGVGLGSFVAKEVGKAGLKGASAVAARATGNATGGAGIGALDAAARGQDISQGATLGAVGGFGGSLLGDVANAATSGIKGGSQLANDLVDGGTLSPNALKPQVGSQSLDEFVGDGVAAGVSAATSLANNLLDDATLNNKVTCQ